MLYVLLIYGNESELSRLTKDAQAKVISGYSAVIDDIVRAGKLRGGDRLKPSSTAMTVRRRDGELSSTSGSFVPDHEQLTGFFVVDGKSEEEVISFAARMPGAEHGSIEIRALWPTSG